MINQSTATVLGFLIAPSVPVLLMGILSLPNTGPWGVFFGVGAIVYVYACIFTLIIGSPTYCLFRKWSLMRWWAVSVVGVTSGAIVGYAYRLPFYPDRYQSGIVQGIGCGFAGLVFWSIWRMGRKKDLDIAVPGKPVQSSRP